MNEVYMELDLSSKIEWFLANCIPKQRIRGSALKSLYYFSPSQVWRASEIQEPFKVKFGPSKLLILHHTIFVKWQWVKRWELLSSYVLHKEHIIGPMKEIFWIFSQVGAFLLTNIHMKRFFWGVVKFLEGLSPPRGWILILYFCNVHKFGGVFPS